MITVIVSKAIILDGSGKMLALRRSKTDHNRPGQWDLPGGTIELGEELAVGTTREIEEEAGLVVDPARLDLIYAQTTPYTDKSTVRLFFVARLSENEPAVTLSYEHEEAKWMSWDEVFKDYGYATHLQLFEYVRDHDLLTKLPL